MLVCSLSLSLSLQVIRSQRMRGWKTVRQWPIFRVANIIVYTIRDVRMPDRTSVLRETMLDRFSVKKLMWLLHVSEMEKKWNKKTNLAAARNPTGRQVVAI